MRTFAQFALLTLFMIPLPSAWSGISSSSPFLDPFWDETALVTSLTWWHIGYCLKCESVSVCDSREPRVPQYRPPARDRVIDDDSQYIVTGEPAKLSILDSLNLALFVSLSVCMQSPSGNGYSRGYDVT